MATVDESSNKTPITSDVVSKAYVISGVPIVFPYKAYPSQITMMDRIVKCLNKRNNCLLESPTGSGKSLALLCASLSWLNQTKKKIMIHNEKLEEHLNSLGVTVEDNEKCPVHYYKNRNNKYDKESGLSEQAKNSSLSDSSSGRPIVTTIRPIEKECETLDEQRKSVQASSSSKRSSISFHDEEFEDFAPSKRYRSSLDASTYSKSAQLSSNNSFPNELLNNMPTTADSDNRASRKSSINTDSAFCTCDPKKEKMKMNVASDTNLPAKLPTIYFGTRTHKQVEQIIRELKKTAYKDCKMCILSSRERACIHPEASHADNKNEACEELLKAEGGPACKYYRNAKFVTHNRPSSLSTAFDLEDFVSICKKQKCCPYYSSRELISASDIVFCPYNYLVDPLIRSAVSISLKGSIIIMDEAHNIEDNARSAASSSFDVVNLEESGVNLEKVGRYSKSDGQSYLYFSDIFKSMANWLKNHSSNLTDYQTFESSAKVYEGDDMLAVLSHVRIGPETFKEFDQKFESVLFLEKDKEAAEIIDLDQPKLSSAALAVMKKLREILNFLYKANMVYVPDYRLVVLKTRRVGQRLRGNRHLVVPANDLELTLNFWCLNPGVAFSDIKDCIHSLIVASGTLSPMASFESELGTTFHTTLEANHVVKKSQLWIGTIGKGPNNVSLNATFQNTGTFTFQDDVGSLILQICSIIPHGVLCFLPSYNLMDKLIDRWEQTGLLEKLSRKKEVLCEPRKIQYFQTVMDEFYGAISSSKNGTGNGALFFAVCRGKVSEGFDFADENARAVITVGIPFPSFKDSQVDLKKKYNDKYSSQRNILSGQEWYEIQAFRAINQALGRCIRHRDDFGALILIDERFQKCIRYQNSLSKWIRKDLLHFTYKDALESLNMFAVDSGLKALE